MRLKIEKERQLVEPLLKNNTLPNSKEWKFIQVEDVLGLKYYRYKHRVLPIVAEREQGDTFYFLYVDTKLPITDLFTEEYRVEDLDESFKDRIKRYILENNITDSNDLIEHIKCNKM